MNKRVLIVDDHPIICVAAKTVLEENGYEAVATCSDGFEALSLIQSLAPEYLLLDIGINSLDGLSLCNVLWRTRLDQDIGIHLTLGQYLCCSLHAGGRTRFYQ
ncbi:response regulator [Pseudomonas hygromyciniae]|uniref:Response regulator n=1 Tax=Pseudomonas hygromyciniae TaxID=2812000 RepID=A0ABX7JZJ8_9PSED|nr:response regulator [Pseudomonas hygromyciniae]QSB39156.1 response regulator [Pseudomonas hygromyciniae]